jgi:hypothetical protein
VKGETDWSHRVATSLRRHGHLAVHNAPLTKPNAFALLFREGKSGAIAAVVASHLARASGTDAGTLEGP